MAEAEPNAHKHCAVDDDRGFANGLAKLIAIAGTLLKIEATESVSQ